MSPVGGGHGKRPVGMDWVCATSTVITQVNQVLWSVDSLTQGNVTPTWHQAVAMCQTLAASDARVTLHEVGMSDVGRPIHALVVTEHLATKKSARAGVEAVKQRLAQRGVQRR